MRIVVRANTFLSQQPEDSGFSFLHRSDLSRIKAGHFSAFFPAFSVHVLAYWVSAYYRMTKWKFSKERLTRLYNGVGFEFRKTFAHCKWKVFQRLPEATDKLRHGQNKGEGVFSSLTTHGITISWTLLMVCLPTMMITSCWASSIRQPLGAHWKNNQSRVSIWFTWPWNQRSGLADHCVLNFVLCPSTETRVTRIPFVVLFVIPERNKSHKELHKATKF